MVKFKEIFSAQFLNEKFDFLGIIEYDRVFVMKRQINFWFICRFTMLCIILEERRKMRKKNIGRKDYFLLSHCA